MNTQKIDALVTARDYINNLKDGIGKAINYYQSGQENKGSNLIYPIAEGIEWLMQVLILCSDVVDSKESIDILKENLYEIVDGFQNEDYILISDIFEYEILTVLDSIQSSLEKIKN